MEQKEHPPTPPPPNRKCIITSKTFTYILCGKRDYGIGRCPRSVSLFQVSMLSYSGQLLLRWTEHLSDSVSYPLSRTRAYKPVTELHYPTGLGKAAMATQAVWNPPNQLPHFPRSEIQILKETRTYKSVYMNTCPHKPLVHRVPIRKSKR